MALIEGQLAFLILSSSTLLLAVGVRWHLVLELVVNDSPGFRQSLYRVLDFSRGPGLVDVVGLHNVLENLLLGESALSLVLASYGFYYHIIVVWMIVFLILRHGDLVMLQYFAPEEFRLECSYLDRFSYFRPNRKKYLLIPTQNDG